MRVRVFDTYILSDRLTSDQTDMIMSPISKKCCNRWTLSPSLRVRCQVHRMLDWGRVSAVCQTCEGVNWHDQTSEFVSENSSSPSKKPKKQRATGFNQDWVDDFPWVKEIEGGMMCTLCIRHQKRPKRLAIGKAPWVDVPCTWIVREALTRHQRSDSHDEAKAFEANRLAPRNIETATEESTKLQAKARIAAFQNLYWLMKQEVPHTTNYIPLNELSKLQGCSVLNNMYQGENNKGESMRFVTEAVLTMGDVTRQSILDEAKQSPWYSIMIDETTDIAVVSEMIIYIRYLKAGVSRTEFLKVLPLPDGKADTITDVLLTFLREDAGLPLDKLCSFGSDGASVMVGKTNGVAAQLRQRVPHLVNNHCVAHRLALAVGQASKGIQYLPKFKDVIGDLHRFYDKSPVRTHGLREIQSLLKDPILKLTEAKDVRWLSHDRATTALRMCLPSVYASLEREAEERNDVKAAGLSVFTQDYRFVLSLHMMCDILPHLSQLSCAMQERDAIYVTVKPLVQGTIAILQGLLQQPGTHYQAAEQRLRELRDSGYNIRGPNPGDTVVFHEKIYLPFVRQVIQNLEDRFPDLPVVEKFAVFDTTRFPDGEGMDDHGETQIEELAQHFGLPTEEAVANWRQVRASLQGTNKKADAAMMWITTNLTASHVPLYQLAAIGLLLPTSTADCERGFSTLKRIKSENRSRLTNKVLNALLTVSMQGPPLHEFNFKRAVKTWFEAKPRRSQIFI